MDLIRGQRFYSSLRCVHKVRFCVNALVKRYPGVKSFEDFTAKVLDKLWHKSYWIALRWLKRELIKCFKGLIFKGTEYWSFLVLTILKEGLVWHQSQSSIIWPSDFSLIVKSHSNPLLLKETTGAFDWSQTHDRHIMSQTQNLLRYATPGVKAKWFCLLSPHDVHVA